MTVPVRHVVYLHGFASSPESSKAEVFRRGLAAAGVGFVSPDLNQPEFETLTTTRMLTQVRAVIEGIPEGPVALVGSSLGAFVAVLAADADLTGRVDRLILLAPALDFGGNRLRQFGPHSVEAWRQAGALRVPHHAWGEEREINFALYEDAAQYDAITLPVRFPTLVFQGEYDEVVKPAMVKQWAAGRPMVDLRLLPDGHQLSTSIERVWRESARFLGVAGGPTEGLRAVPQS
ncbi:MAG: alpha/beta fold hydrolase [Acidobacteria bacterium]|nr:alpha/beta fold hydrolase [Acidobacteriota bacterium]